MRKDTRLRRLRELSRILKNHSKLFPTIKWDIREWEEKLECGTAACALGSACHHAPFKRAGLKMRVDTWGDDEQFAEFTPMFKGETEMAAGASFFGISYEEACWLFDPCYYHKRSGGYYNSAVVNKYVTPKVVAKRVDKLIKHYQNDNDPLYEQWQEPYPHYRYGLE